MLYRDVDNKLDMQLTISMEQIHPIIPMLERGLPIIPLDAVRTDEGSFIDLFICGDAGKQMEGTLLPYKPEKIAECLIVRIKADEMEFASEILDKISEIPSALRIGLYLKGKRIYADYRFHHSDIAMISDVGQRISDARNGLRIEDLGPCTGGISKMLQVNSRIHLGIVAYEANILDKLGLNLEKDNDCLIEYLTTPLSDKGLGVIVYHNGKLDPYNFKPIGNQIFLGHVKSPFLETIWKRSNALRLPRASILGKPVNGAYRAFIFLPFSMIASQISILYDTAKSHPESNFRLLAARTYSEEVWNWI